MKTRKIIKIATIFIAVSIFTGCSSIPKNDDVLGSKESSQYRLKSVPGGTSIKMSKQDKLVFEAMAYLNTPYKFGGNSVEEGFDCSSYTQHVFKKAAGFNLARVSAEQAKQGKSIKSSEVKKGDLVFFKIKSKRINHVGIYIGDGNFIHAPTTGSVVRIESLETSYWKNKISVVKRVL